MLNMLNMSIDWRLVRLVHCQKVKHELDFNLVQFVSVWKWNRVLLDIIVNDRQST